MPGFTIIVFANGVVSYVSGWHEGREAANKHVSDMIEDTYSESGQVNFLFDGNDDIVVVDEGGQAVSAWNRHSPKSVKDFADFDFGKYLGDDAERKARKLIGFQITNLAGENIHGTDEDPFQLTSVEVLTDAAVLTAKGWAVDKEFLVTEVFGGDIEEPSFVSNISLKESNLGSLGMR
jgi:hypothetical protein